MTKAGIAIAGGLLGLIVALWQPLHKRKEAPAEPEAANPDAPPQPNQVAPPAALEADAERKKLMREMAKKGGQKSAETRKRKAAERKAASGGIPA